MLLFLQVRETKLFVLAAIKMLKELAAIFQKMECQKYIDLHTVTQSGPMAIYRRVHVLSQGAAVAANGVQSMLALYEYDCMNTKFRLLQTSGFSKQWAEGDSMALSASSGPAQWLPLPLQALGQKTFDLLCPDGKDN